MNMMVICAKVVTCLLVVAEALRIVGLKQELLYSSFPQVVDRFYLTLILFVIAFLWDELVRPFDQKISL